LIKTGILPTVLEKYKTSVLPFYQSQNSFVTKMMFGRAKNVGSIGVIIHTADDLIDNS